jgi:hypothetical protein
VLENADIARDLVGRVLDELTPKQGCSPEAATKQATVSVLAALVVVARRRGIDGILLDSIFSCLFTAWDADELRPRIDELLGDLRAAEQAEEGGEAEL